MDLLLLLSLVLLALALVFARGTLPRFPRTVRRPELLALALGMFVAGMGCTAAQLASAEASVTALVAASQSPVPCQALTAADGTSAGEVCGTVDSLVGGFANLVNSILKDVPPKAGVKAAPAAVSHVCWPVGGASIYLRADLEADVRASLAAKAKSAK